MLGGMQSYMAGGKFGHGFAAAGIGAAFGGGEVSPTGFVKAAVLGGIASEITGGKFKNGAASAAFMYAVRSGAQKLRTFNNSENNIDPRGKNPHTIDGSRPTGKGSFTDEKVNEIDGKLNSFREQYGGTTKGSVDETALFLSKSQLVDISLEYNIEVGVVIGSDGTIREITTDYYYRSVSPYPEIGQSVWHTHPYSDAELSLIDMQTAKGHRGMVFSTNGNGVTWSHNGVGSNVYDSDVIYGKVPINNLRVYSGRKWNAWNNAYIKLF